MATRVLKFKCIVSKFLGGQYSPLKSYLPTDSVLGLARGAEIDTNSCPGENFNPDASVNRQGH